MPTSHLERIAALEASLEDLERRYIADMGEVKGDVKAILAKLNQMTGGQRAWLGLFGLLGGLLGAVASFITIVLRHSQH